MSSNSSITETQQTVSQWAEQTFGSVGSNASVAARVNKEMAELIMELARDDNSPKMGDEIADVVICLMRLADRNGIDMLEEVDRKMKINRSREWVLDGHGHGQHK